MSTMGAEVLILECAEFIEKESRLYDGGCSVSLIMIHKHLSYMDYKNAYRIAGELYGTLCDEDVKRVERMMQEGKPQDQINEAYENDSAMLAWLEDLMDFLAVDDLTKIDNKEGI